MRKHLWLFLFSLLLISCGPSDGEVALEQEPAATAVPAPAEEVVADTAVPQPTDEPTAVPQPTATSQPTDDPTDEPEPVGETAVEADNNVAQLADTFPATNFQEAAVIRDHDWLRGATEPAVTIIEYGDFQ